jgi:hypothetical protein
MGIFSEYTLAADLAERAFRTCSITDFEHCIEEFELDPLKEKMDNGIYPWAVYIKVVDQDTEITTLGTLFYKEHLDYTQGPLACAYVFAADEEEAENRALELWEEYQSGEQPIKSILVFTIILDADGEISNMNRMTAYTQNLHLEDSIKAYNNSVEVRVIADNIDEAITRARALYDKWIDEGLELMGSVGEED